MNTESGPRAARLLVSLSRRQKPIGAPTSKHRTEESGQLSLGERTGAGIAINAAWHGAALVQTCRLRIRAASSVYSTWRPSV